MLVASLEGFREDFIGTLGPFIGTSKATKIVNSAEAHIRAEAEAGARKAIPDIEIAVAHRARDAVKPYVIAAVAMSAVALGVGGFALWKARKR